SLVADFLVATPRRFLEAYPDPFSQVPAVPGANPECAENVSENAVEAPQIHEIRARTASARPKRGFPKAIPRAALLRIAENLIGLVEFLEPSMGFRVVRISIGVVLGRQAP